MRSVRHDDGAGVRKDIFIVNPSSGKGRTRRLWASLRERLEAGGYLVNEFQTSGPSDAEEFARGLGEGEYDVIHSVGGDGTLNEVINGLARRWLVDEGRSSIPTAVSVVPTGSGNDFARTLGINKDVLSNASALMGGRIVPVDLGLVGGRYFINVSGAGFDAEVVSRFNEGKTKGGPKGALGYLSALVSTLSGFRAFDAEITLDGESFRGKILLIAVGNGKYYGGGMRITPGADPHDGYFDVCWVDGMSKLSFLASLASVFPGRHTTNPKVHMHRARMVGIAGGNARIQADGEVLGNLPTAWSLIPGVLKIMVPDSSSS